MKPILAWHFTAPEGALRYDHAGYVPEIGETLRHDGPIAMCAKGFHASRNPVRALWYAPSLWVSRVRLSGGIIHDRCKVVASERTVLWRADAREAVATFARWCADRAAAWDGDAAPLVLRCAAQNAADSASIVSHGWPQGAAYAAAHAAEAIGAARYASARVGSARELAPRRLTAWYERDAAIAAESRAQYRKLTALLHALAPIGDQP